MRLLPVAAAALAAILLLLPLFNISALNSEFINYTKKLPLEQDHPHIQASIDSISDASIASLCLLRPFAVIPYMCSAGDGSSPSLYAVLQHQYATYDLLSHNIPTQFVIAAIRSLEGAAQAAITLDNYHVLLDNGEQVASDIYLLADIGRLSHALSEALLRVLIHFELGLCRVTFVHDTILLGLKTLEQSRIDRFVSGLRMLPLNRVISILFDASTDSLTHTRLEVDRVASIATALSSVLDRLEPLQVRIATRCTERGASTLCVQVAELFRSKYRLEAVFANIDDLLAIIKTDDIRQPLQSAHPAEYSLFFAVPLVQTNRDALGQMLKQVRAAREGGERVLA